MRVLFDSELACVGGGETSDGSEGGFGGGGYGAETGDSSTASLGCDMAGVVVGSLFVEFGPLTAGLIGLIAREACQNATADAGGSVNVASNDTTH
jgi:hypothetical protein